MPHQRHFTILCEDANKNVYGQLNRDYAINCLCIGRPTMSVHLAGQFLGNNYDPFNCCDLNTEIKDPNQRLIYCFAYLYDGFTRKKMLMYMNFLRE